MHAIVEAVRYDRLRAPVTLLFGDDAGRRARVARLVAERGGRLAGHVALAGAEERLDQQAIAHIVVVDATGKDDVLCDRLLARIVEGVAARRFDALVLLPAAAIERAGPFVGLAEILIDAADDEIGASLDRLIAGRPAGVAEEDDEAYRRRLAMLGDEVARVARALSAMATEGAAPFAASDPASAAAERRFLRDHIRLRRLRERHFDRALFADPAWDILLDLRLATLEGRRVAVSSLCIAAAVPPTTGLRWIGLMTDRGLLMRIADPDDGRRVFMALTPAADIAMARYATAALAPESGR